MAVVELHFELKLPHGPNPNWPFVAVVGGADLDGDGTVEDNGELGIFTRKENTWAFQQTVAKLEGTIFFVQFTVGRDVSYELTIKDGTGKLLFVHQNITIDPTGIVRWRFPS